MLVHHSKHSLTKHMNYYIRITEISSVFFFFFFFFFLISYLWHTKVATAILIKTMNSTFLKNGDNTLLLCNTLP